MVACFVVVTILVVFKAFNEVPWSLTNMEGLRKQLGQLITLLLLW